MRPLRIEPAEIRVTLEIMVSELRSLNEYIKKADPLIKKVHGNDPSMQSVMLVIEQDIKPALKEILEHPLVE